MTLVARKLIVAGTVAAVLLLANVLVIANWLEYAGVTGLAQYIRSEYLTGTAITIIVVLIVLLMPTQLITKCRTCDHLLLRQGSYCPRCGGKL